VIRFAVSFEYQKLLNARVPIFNEPKRYMSWSSASRRSISGFMLLTPVTMEFLQIIPIEKKRLKMNTLFEKPHLSGLHVTVFPLPLTISKDPQPNFLTVVKYAL